jgi:VWFA-related protein
MTFPRTPVFTRLFAAAFLLMGLPSMLGGRQSSAEKPSPQGAPLRVSTRLVEVSVIVEHQGQPVTGLQKENFALYDKGVPQEIAFFSEETNRAQTAVAAAASAQPADVFTNRLAEKAGVPSSVTVILLDTLNTHFADMGRARQQVVQLLSALKPNDRIALYALSDQLYVLHDFTNDSSSLLRALERYKGAESHQMTGSEPVAVGSDAGSTDENDLDALLASALQRAVTFFTMSRVEATADALEAIANHLAALPGRKNLVWISSSFPFDIAFDAPITQGVAAITPERHTFSAEIEEAAKALNNANISIYPVDPRGLVAAIQPYGLPPPPQTLTRPPRGPSAATGPSQQTLDTMNILADRTGGSAFYNTNDLGAAIRHAIDDSRDVYVLGYYPSHGQWDGRFREIKVELKHGSAELRYRRGYFAFSPTEDDATKQKQLSDAMHSSLEDTELGLTLQADAVPNAAKRQLLTHLKLDPAQMAFEQRDGRFVDQLEVAWVQLDADGKSLSAVTQTNDLNLLPETYQKLKAELTIRNLVDLRPGTEVLRVVARDKGTGAIGSLNVPVDKLFATH